MSNRTFTFRLDDRFVPELEHESILRQLDEVREPHMKEWEGPPDRYYDVYYHFLAAVQLSDFRHSLVCYTPTGVARQLWGKSGPRVDRVRASVDLMWEAPTVLTRAQPARQDPNRMVQYQMRFHTLSAQSEPEDGGRSRVETPWIIFDSYLLAELRSSDTVRRDIFFRSQLKTEMHRGFYQALVRLRNEGVDRIELADLFRLAGSDAVRSNPSDARKKFGPAWQVLVNYKFLAKEPFMPEGWPGRPFMQVEWGDAIVPTEGMELVFETLTAGAGVRANMAEQLIRDYPESATKWASIFKAGAIEGKENIAGYLVAAIRADRSVEKVVERAGNPPTSAGVSPKRATPDAVDRDKILPWEALLKQGGGLERLRAEVLPTVLRAAGEPKPAMVLGIASVAERLQKAFGKLEWQPTINVLYRIIPHLHGKDRPANYILHCLEKEAGIQPAEEIRDASIPSAGPVSIPEAPQAAPSSPDPADLKDGKTPDIAAQLFTHLQSIISGLERNPTPSAARNALDEVRHRRKSAATKPELLPVLAKIEELATRILRS